mmetsp:Transcript_120345/g.376493  ORF Transcript_120345/g.376493 Transcript_120345/m.376493 type:complete len:207 (-) Transcript_120345:352-972(-)
MHEDQGVAVAAPELRLELPSHIGNACRQPGLEHQCGVVYVRPSLIWCANGQAPEVTMVADDGRVALRASACAGSTTAAKASSATCLPRSLRHRCRHGLLRIARYPGILGHSVQPRKSPAGHGLWLGHQRGRTRRLRTAAVLSALGRARPGAPALHGFECRRFVAGPGLCRLLLHALALHALGLLAALVLPLPARGARHGVSVQRED